MKTLLLGAAVLAFAACGSDSPDDPINPDDPMNPDDPDNPDDPNDPDTTALDRDELATVIGAHARAEFALQLAAAELSRGRPVEGYQVTSSTLELSTGSGVAGNMSYALEFYCHDSAQPRNLVPCNGAADHSHFKVTATGSQSIGAMSMDQMSRVVDWEIRDIALGKARFRGPDDVTVTTQVESGAKYAMTFFATYADVRFSYNQVIPTYGTINFMLAVERTRGSDVRSFSSTGLLTYTNTGATLTLDGANYTIDLATGAVVKL